MAVADVKESEPHPGDVHSVIEPDANSLAEQESEGTATACTAA